VPGKRRGERRGRQCAALPFAEEKGELRVLLVTSRETQRWVLPKGWTEKRLSPHALAAKEAFEEAGVLGEVERRPIGRYRYLKRGPRNQVTPCSVRVFPLRVQRLLDDWPERRERQRRWFSAAEAAMAVEEGGLVTLLLGLAMPHADTAGGRGASPLGDASEAGDCDGARQVSGAHGEDRDSPDLVVQEAEADDTGRRKDQDGE
jgi:8-oxo-dGTP pyrophosphatase MutT (NUDIX family)